MNGPRLSVVVPTFGRREFLARTLRSLARQDDAPSFEVITIDDGADAGMPEFARGVGVPFPLEAIFHPKTRGRAATRNTGIARASGEIVLFLDGDMEVVPRFLAAHAAAHDRIRAESATGGARSVVLGNIVTAPEVPRSAFVHYIDSRGVQKITPGAPIPSRYFMTGNSSVAAELLKEAGPFDEAFDEYGGEDTEMGYRLGIRGGVFAFAKDGISNHLDLNSVPRMAERLARYGERMLPLLVERVPAARKELHLDLVEPAHGSDSLRVRAMKIAAALACRPLFWRPAAALAGALPAFVRADSLFDFVRAAAYLDGYSRALRSRKVR